MIRLALDVSPTRSRSSSTSYHPAVTLFPASTVARAKESPLDPGENTTLASMDIETIIVLLQDPGPRLLPNTASPLPTTRRNIPQQKTPVHAYTADFLLVAVPLATAVRAQKHLAGAALVELLLLADDAGVLLADGGGEGLFVADGLDELLQAVR